MNLNSLRCRKCSGTIDVNPNKKTELYCIFCGAEYSYRDFSEKAIPIPVKMNKPKNDKPLAELGNIVKLLRFLPILGIVISVMLTFLAQKPETDKLDIKNPDVVNQEISASNELEEGVEEINISELKNIPKPIRVNKFLNKEAGTSSEFQVQSILENSSDGSRSIYGLYKNTGKNTLLSIAMEINLLDKNKKLIKSESAQFSHSVLAPDEVSFVSFRIPQEDSKFNYDFSSSLSSGDSIENVSSIDITEIKFYHNTLTREIKAKAKVKNTKAQKIGLLWFTLVTYGNDNRPNDEVINLTTLTEIEPNEVKDIEFIFFNKVEIPMYYKIYSSGALIGN